MSDYSESDSTIESRLFEDKTGHTIENYPGEIDGEFLLGIDDWGGWYYDPVKDSIHNFQLEGGENSPLELTAGFSVEGEETEDYEDISELARDLVDKTKLGHAMVLADELSAKTHMSKPQAKVYSLRDVYDAGRTQTAAVLDKSVNTIDNQRSQAKKKAKHAKQFVRIINKYSTD